METKSIGVNVIEEQLKETETQLQTLEATYRQLEEEFGRKREFAILTAEQLKGAIVVLRGLLEQSQAPDNKDGAEPPKTDE